MEKKKVGRPTNLIKSDLLKLRIDSDTLSKIDKVAEESNQTRSELVRDILPIISSKDFEDMISLNSLQRLEKYSLDCIQYFEKENIKINVKDISSNFPAYIFPISEASKVLYIKYPTYKVRMLLPHMSDAIEKIIRPILKDVDRISTIYETQCLIMRNYGERIESTFVPEVMCLRSNLEENFKLKSEICLLLSEKGIKSEVWPAYYIISKDIKIEKEEDEEYIVAVK